MIKQKVKAEKRMRVWLALGALMVMAGCNTPPKVTQDALPEFNPANYTTYTVLKGEGSTPGGTVPASPTLVRAARELTDEVLTSKGLTKGDEASADIAFQIAGSSMPQVDVFDYGFAYSRHSWRWGYTTVYDVNSYTEGTLVVNAFDTRTKELVWQGYSTQRTSTGKFSDERILETLRAVLEAYPGK